MALDLRTAKRTAFGSSTASSNGCCIPRLKRDWIKFDLPTDKSFEFGSILERHFYLLEFVFEYLDATDLHVACLVNENWKWVATRELEKRTYPTWVSCVFRRKLCKIETSTRFGWNNESCFILAYDGIRVRKHFHNVYLHGADTRMTFTDYIERELKLSNKRNYCVIECRHITPANIVPSQRVLYQGFSLPSIPNIRTAIFHCSADNIYPLAGIVSGDEEIKCMLVLTAGESEYTIEMFNTAIIRGMDVGVAFGGGAVDIAVSSTRQDNADGGRGILCIGFIEKKGNAADFNAYSTVMNLLSHSNNNTFANHILMLKYTSKLRKHGVIFVFGSFYNVNITVELKMIEQLFPNYVTIHIESYIEIGWNTREIQEFMEDRTPELATPRYGTSKYLVQRYHNWATVVVLITWGNIQR